MMVPEEVSYFSLCSTCHTAFQYLVFTVVMDNRLKIKHKKYDFKFKMTVLQEQETSTIPKNQLARKYLISPKLLRDWISNKDKIRKGYKELGAKRNRYSGGGRKMNFTEIGEAVFSFYKNCRMKKLHVSRKRLRLYAKQVYREMVNDGRAEG